MNNGARPGQDPAVAGLQEPRHEIRTATHADVPGLVGGLVALLGEIGGSPAPAEQLEAAARALIDDPGAGLVLVAECEGKIVGVLGASWQSAIRIPGRYGLIQELWVAPDYRYLEIGTHLLGELAALAREHGVERLEVGLPSDRYPNLAATESFYETNLFKSIGLRMRRLL